MSSSSGRGGGSRRGRPPGTKNSSNSGTPAPISEARKPARRQEVRTNDGLWSQMGFTQPGGNGGGAGGNGGGASAQAGGGSGGNDEVEEGRQEEKAAEQPDVSAASSAQPQVRQRCLPKTA